MTRSPPTVPARSLFARVATSPGVLRAALLVPFVACDKTPAPTAEATLAKLGPTVPLRATVTDGAVDVELGTQENDGDLQSTPCPQVHAQATLNGQPMMVTSTGSAQQEMYPGDGCENALGNACTPPSFHAALDAGPGTELSIRVSDSSGSLAFDALLTRPTVAFQGANDGTLHVGHVVNLALSAFPPSTSYLTIEFLTPAPPGGGSLDASSDDSGPEASAPDSSLPDGSSSLPSSRLVFECDTGEGAGVGSCGAQLTPTGVSFVVPYYPPQPGVLRLGGFAPTVSRNCVGASSCDVEGVPAPPTVDLVSAIAP
jgi:hypothetical protein